MPLILNFLMKIFQNYKKVKRIMHPNVPIFGNKVSPIAGVPLSGIRCLMIRGEADVIIIKCTRNGRCLRASLVAQW